MTANRLNRFERAAARIQSTYHVHVEWAPANREYVVDTAPCGNARNAERYARELAADARNVDHWSRNHGR